MVPDDAPRLREIHACAGVAAWWGQPEPDFPIADDPSATRLTLFANGELAGLLQFSEETDPNYRHARIDIFIAPALQNRGFGTDALALLLEYLLRERGHHRVTIDPAATNHAAIRCYEKAGFRRVGVMRSAERDGSGAWRDVLLMEYVTAPTPPAGRGADARSSRAS